MAHGFDIDLVTLPYTIPGSRLFVLRDGDALTVYEAAYERSLADSVVVSGIDLEVRRVTRASIEFTDGSMLVVSDGAALLGRLPDGEELAFPVDGMPRVWRSGSGGSSGPGVPGAEFEAALTEATRRTSEWANRTPQVDAAWQGLVNLCWWVLGCNTLVLGGAAEGRAVVPSKIGYVGLWQWDAYFIAIGLRHGDPALAIEQVRIAVSRQQADGQLPDVVHEAGVLASSDDLPPIDLENLRAMASPTLAHSRIPLTKPPLTALAVSLVAPDLVDEFLDPILASQDWWYEHSDPGQTGLPAYLHPYSSGLDDSPVFDRDAIVRSPDLAAYLISQDQMLSGWFRERGRDADAERCASRAARTTALLLEHWVVDERRFAAVGERGQELTTDLVLGLMPLLVDGLDPDVVDDLVGALHDPQRFGAVHPLPTVALSDADFSPTRMWRGPVWVNTNWLVAHGLRRQGRDEEADALELATLRMVEAAGGPHEYFNPLDATKPPRATTAFGWSSALVVDMAVRAARRR